MYSHPAFRVTDSDDLTAFIEARRFATVVVAGADGPVAAHLPMMTLRVDGGGILEGHVATANPLVAAVAGGARALAIFHGADAYVTPSYYQSKREHGRVVPTWNYIAAHVTGEIETFSGAAELRMHIDQLTRAMESGGDAPWKVSDAPGDYIERMIGAITGLRLRISTIEGVRKLSQNRSEPDRAGVFHGFTNSADPGARALAGEMATQTASDLTTEATARR